jgi:hypothetical protein
MRKRQRLLNGNKSNSELTVVEFTVQYSIVLLKGMSVQIIIIMLLHLYHVNVKFC